MVSVIHLARGFTLRGYPTEWKGNHSITAPFSSMGTTTDDPSLSYVQGICFSGVDIRVRGLHSMMWSPMPRRLLRCIG